MFLFFMSFFFNGNSQNLKEATKSNNSSQARTHNYLAFGVDLFGGTGLWAYNKGSDNEAIKNNRGWDRSRFVAQLAIQPMVEYRMGSFLFGVNLGYTIFDEFEMVPQQHTSLEYKIYYISSSKHIYLKHLGGHLGYFLFQNEKFGVSPIGSFGVSSITTTHPEKDRYKQLYFGSLEMRLSFYKQKHIFNVGVFYKENFWKMNSMKYFYEKNQLFFIGIKGGIQWKG